MPPGSTSMRPSSMGARSPSTGRQANYLLNVLRLKAGEAVLIFNGRDGEWRAEVAVEGRKAADLVCVEQTRPQDRRPTSSMPSHP